MKNVRPVIDRLMSRVTQAPSGCLEWTGATRGAMGYSTLGNEPGKLPKMLYGHVVSYEHHHGAIPAGMVVRHTCDNPICVSPDHLILGTNSDNHQDMVQRGRRGVNTPHKVTELEVKAMRAERASGATLTSLAAKYGLSLAQVSKICNGQAWKHV